MALTPSQTVGPFFAYGLTPRDYGGRELAGNVLAGADTLGERIRIEGRVLDGDGAAVGDALIELWQADAAGRYASAQANSAFPGFGRAATSPDGAYAFETVKPGAVGAQAPHAILIVFARGVLRHLYTRVYFADEPANAADAVLAQVPADARATLIAPRAMRDGRAVYRFDIRLQGPGETVFFES